MYLQIRPQLPHHHPRGSVSVGNPVGAGWRCVPQLVPILLVGLLGAPVRAEPRVWIPAPGSAIHYHADHPLHEIHGRSVSLSGTLVWDPERPLSMTGVVGQVFSVPVTSFDSGNRNRDANFCALLRCDRFPRLHFVPESVTGTTWTGTAGEAYVTGRLYVAGRKRRITVPVRLRRPAVERLELTSRFTIRLSEFDLEPPRLLFLAVADPVEVDVRLILVPGMPTPSP